MTIRIGQTLHEFLRQQYDYEVAMANYASRAWPGDWYTHERGYQAELKAGAPNFQTIVLLEQEGQRVDGEEWLSERLFHLEVWQPRRVIAEVNAKRRLLEIHGDDNQECMLNNEPEPCDTMRVLSLPYAAHPNYNPAWSPR